MSQHTALERNTLAQALYVLNVLRRTWKSLERLYCASVLWGKLEELVSVWTEMSMSWDLLQIAEYFFFSFFYSTNIFYSKDQRLNDFLATKNLFKDK